MLDGAKRIIELYEDDEFKPLIIQGDHGYGKSSYANRLIAEVYSIDRVKGNWNTDIFKRHIGFHPKHVLDLWMNKRGRDHCFHWDDAGLWLHSLDYQDPFVKDVGKYMQVVRTDWACVMFTAIGKEDISSKIRGLRNAIIIDITKEGVDETHPNRRTASAYIERKTTKGRIWKDYQWEEYFDSWVPGEYEKNRKGMILKQDGFYGWYKPLRDKYGDMAKARMRKRIADHPDLSKDKVEF